MSASKIYFCSFADCNLLPSLIRIRRQALQLEVFEKVRIFTQFSLTGKGKKNVRKIIKKTKSRRGYGYWAWKTDVIEQMFKIMNDDDILIYADAGCEINQNGKHKLMEYIDLTQKNDICAVQLPDCMSDINYTKKDTLDYFNKVPLEKQKQGQIQATAFFLKKNPYTRRLLDEWKTIMNIDNSHLFDDTPSLVKENPGFIGHRHDQSVLSLLLKQNHFYALPIDNFWKGEDSWQDLYESEPLLFKRNKQTILGYIYKTLLKLIPIPSEH